MDKESLIRERAYLLWEQAGRPECNGEQFWFAALIALGDAPAEAAVDAPAAAAAPPDAKTSPPERTAKTAVR